VADETNTENPENTDETPAEGTQPADKPKRSRRKAEPEAAAPEAAEKPKRTRKKAEEAAESEEAPVVSEEVQAEAEQVEAEPEPTPDPVAGPPAEAPVAEESPAEEPAAAQEPAAAEEPAAGPAPDVEGEATAAETPETEDEAAAEAEGAEAPVRTRGPKPKKKRLPRSQRHTHAKPRREPAATRKPITRLPKPEGERGRDQQRRGVVVSAAMDKTIVVRVDSIKAHPRYKKVIRRSKKFHAHDEQNQAKAGDVVRIVETRPLSKTKRWRLAEIIEVAK
jgi:small subunit ribosomal protein S17